MASDEKDSAIPKSIREGKSVRINRWLEDRIATMKPSRALAEKVLSATLPEELIRKQVREIHQDVLANSHHLLEANFRAIHLGDLEFLFDAYDRRFFDRLCRRGLESTTLRFRMSTRMTQAGGKTTRIAKADGELSYEIAIAIGTLFDGFHGTDRRVTVCGLECTNRLEALQRIFEHEIVHLIEQLCWSNSDCSASRFQRIAARFFLHRAHTHHLVTRRERAAESGIRVGSPVAFAFENRRLAGRVNRITKRATVLVEDPNGMEYRDGRRYKAYYVPITSLEPLEEGGT